jgi:gliding motility-associated-like protein
MKKWLILGAIFVLGYYYTNAQILINADVTINGFRHNHDCGNDAGGNNPDPRYRVWIGSNNGNFTQSTNGPGIYPGCADTYGADEIPCSFWNPGLINAANIVGQPINQINVDLQSWEEDGCGSDCTPNTCTFNSDDIRCPRTRVGDIDFWQLPPCQNNTYVGEFTNGSFLSMHNRCSDNNGKGYGIDQLIINWSFASSPTILTDAAPFDRTLCLGDATTLTIDVNTWNGWSLAQNVQWQISENTDCAGATGWTNIPGANSLTYVPAQIPGTRLYRCIISSNCNDINVQNVISQCVRVTYHPYAAPILSAVCGGTTVSDVPVQFCTTLPPAAGAAVGTGFQWSVSPSAGVTILNPNDPCTDIIFDDQNTYTVTLTYTDACAAADAQAICITSVSAPSCDMIYVDAVTGNNANLGYPDEPVANLWRAMELVAGDRTNIRISGGTYIEPNIINVVDNLVIEGSWINNSGVWTKSSAANTNLIFSGEETLSASVTQKVGIKAIGVSNWSVQDLNISTTNNTGTAADGRGKSNYGMLINDCSDYSITRVQVTVGLASNGGNGVNGLPGASGVQGGIGMAGHCDNNTTNRLGGDGAAANGVGIRQGGAGGNGGQGADYNSNNNTAGANGQNGGAGAAGGTNFGAAGSSGGCGTSTDRDGRKGQNGTNGIAGANATATPPLANNTFNDFWIPNGQSASGVDGGGGGGGKGGGGGGRQNGTFCDDGGGSGGGGGGSGGEGGQAGTGGMGAGGAFGIYRFNSSLNDNIQNIIINTPGSVAQGGAAGLGAAGGAGGPGGCGAGGNNTSETAGGVRGNNGGLCSTSDVCPSDPNEVGAGGQGGAGGAGGAGGNGQPGAPGINAFMVTDGILSNPSTSIPNPTTIALQYPVNAKGCVNSEISLTNTNPTTWILNGASLIEDAAQGVSSYTFSSSPLLVSYANDGVYDIGTNGANYVNWIRIIDGTRPATATFNVPPSVCSGSNFSVSANPWGTEVAWEWVLFDTDANNPIATSNQQSPSFTAPVVGSTTIFNIRYRVRESCCGWSIPYYTTVEIGQSFTPVIVANGPTTFCTGGTVELTTSGGGDYLWSNGATSSSINVNASGTFTVTVTDNSGCQGTSAPVTVTVNPAPVATINVIGDLDLCNNATVTLQANASSAYIWNNGETTQSIVVNTPGSYEVTIVDGNGCTATSASVEVTQVAVEINSSAGDQLCPGESLELEAGAADSYQWQLNGSNIPGETNPTLTVTQPGTYTVVAEVGACTITADEFVITEFDPFILINGASAVCPGNPVTLQSTIGDTYQWSLNGNPIAGATNQNYATDTPGSYTVTVTLGTCSATSNPISLTSFTTDLVASGPTTICVGESVDLTATGGDDYSWTLNGNPIGGSTGSITATQGGTYVVTISNDNGCSANETIEVIISPTMTATGNVVNATCGNNNGSINLNISGGTSPFSYAWSNGTTTALNSNLGQGNYTVTITDAAGCSIQENYTITDSGPVVAAITPPAATINSGGSVNLTASGGVSYSWSPTIGLSCSDCPNPVASPTETTTYVVTVTDVNGCTGTAEITIVVEAACTDVFIPTIFSPNKDGNNDFVCVYGSCIASMTFEIYNRWGEKVFETGDPNDCWDGTFRDKELNTGTFVYKAIITLESGEEIVKSGTIALVK